jgi:glutathione S-transferase
LRFFLGMNSTLPILYSFRRCPYAIRARLALSYAGIRAKVREVVLKNKPQALLDASAKGTVPVLCGSHNLIIEESLDIMVWALGQYDPEGWLDHYTESAHWVRENDDEFKPLLDAYKYPQSTPVNDPTAHRQKAIPFIEKLELALQHSPFLLGSAPRLADAALFPFIRQFAMVDRQWFDLSPYPNLINWLNHWLAQPFFIGIMKKYEPWEGQDEPVL